MGGETLHIDVAIIGGGIAGLWSLEHLRGRGYSAILFEREMLGGYQTIASQGMIHGGIKYALAGTWNEDARVIARMPALWRDCLAGTGSIDLRGCRVLSDELFLWSSGDLPSRVGTFLASKALRSHVERVAPQDYPEPLRSDRFRGQVYRLADLALDAASLVATLAARQKEALFRVDWKQSNLGIQGGRAVLKVPGLTVVPEQLLLMAGAGNEALRDKLNSTTPAMQRRPLQQVLVRHEYPEALFGHCVGTRASPRLTISSHRDSQGRPVWYLGGDLATGGAEQEPGLLIERAQRELDTLLPWLDLGSTEWATIKLDRAEPRQETGARPDRAYVGKLNGVDNARAGWPIKLALTPDLAGEVERQMREDGIEPAHRPDLTRLAHLPRPALAQPCWDSLFS